LVTLSQTQEGPIYDKIIGFLKEFEWEPESVSTSEGDHYNLTLIAHLDIKEIKIHLKFSENGHWIYFSAIFLPEVKRNHLAVYEKLLQLNYSTTLTKFGLSSSGNVYALIELPLLTLDFQEFKFALRRLTNDINKFLIPMASLLQKENGNENSKSE
jgi:hypothetical protein